MSIFVVLKHNESHMLILFLSYPLLYHYYPDYLHKIYNLRQRSHKVLIIL